MNVQSSTPKTSLLERSTAWLAGNHPLPQVHKALRAIISQATKGDIAIDADCCDTCDALTEHYVDRGGDLTDLPVLPGRPRPTDVADHGSGGGPFDCGSLHPDSEAAEPLSDEEKQKRIKDLRLILNSMRGA